MNTHHPEPVLLVCADHDQANAILDRLYVAGVSAIGPAPTAGLALTLAAQTAARSAILAGEPEGRRDLRRLADELSKTWGIDCFVLPAVDGEPDPVRDPSGNGPMATLRRILRRADLNRVRSS